jgi:alpha-tubulin suppressor-like RCC1 family protein
LNLECGKLFSVGYNKNSCIGDDTINNCLTIKQIDFLKNIFIVNIVCGGSHCLSISNKGEIFSWGLNVWGQLGIEIGEYRENEKQLTPIKIFKI